MELEQIANLVGEVVIYDGAVREICGVHIYISLDGIKSCRLHLIGVDGFVKPNKVSFFEIKSMKGFCNGRKEIN